MGSLSIPGERIYVRTKVEGFKSRSISMRLSLYDAATKRRFPGASNVDVAQQKLDSPSDRSVVPVWLVCPPDASPPATSCASSSTTATTASCSPSATVRAFARALPQAPTPTARWERPLSAAA